MRVLALVGVQWKWPKCSFTNHLRDYDPDSASSPAGGTASVEYTDFASKVFMVSSSLIR